VCDDAVSLRAATCSDHDKCFHAQSHEHGALAQTDGPRCRERDCFRFQSALHIQCACFLLASDMFNLSYHFRSSIFLPTLCQSFDVAEELDSILASSSDSVVVVDFSTTW
jgi:hypothetical protein